MFSDLRERHADGSAFSRLDLGERYFLRFFPGSRTLVISFYAMGQVGADSASKQDPWGYKFLRKFGFSILGVVPASADWYRHASLHEFFRSPRFADFAAGFDRVIFYGGSMGGYAALAFSDSIVGAEVIALSPQSTLSAALVPWESRFRNGAAEDWSGDFADAALCLRRSRRVHVIYDPHLVLDRRHVARLPADRVSEVRVPFIGHNTPLWLARAGQLQPLIEGLLEDNFDKAAFIRRYRTTARQTAHYCLALGVRAGTRRPALARWALDKAMALSSDDWTGLLEIADGYQASGNGQAAEATLRLLVERKPQIPNGHYRLSRFLKALDRDDEAADCASEAARLQPRNRIYANWARQLAAARDAKATPMTAPTPVPTPAKLPHVEDIWVSRELQITLYRYDAADRVLVVFAPAAPTRETFGASLLRKLRINHIAVTCESSDWYQYQDMDAAAQALGKAAARFAFRVHYGSSMGAFGALFFSGAAQPHRVIAVAPQFSIEPDTPPNEPRWATNNPRIFKLGGFLKGGMAKRISSSADIVVLYDPLNPDARHAELIEAQRPIRKVALHGLGHGALFALAQMGLASELVLRLAEPEPDLLALRRDLRARRRRSIDYFSNLLPALLKRGRTRWMRAFMPDAIAALGEQDFGHASGLTAMARAVGDPALVARVLLAQIDLAIIDNASVLLLRLRQMGDALVGEGLINAALERCAAWIDNRAAPPVADLARLHNTLRRYGERDPLGCTRVRSAVRLYKWSGTPETAILAMLIRASLLDLAGRRAEAVETLTEACFHVGGWHPLNLEIARLWSHFGDNPQAVQYARRVLAHHPGDEQALMFLGGRLEALAEPAQADDCYRQLLDTLTPDRPSWLLAGVGRSRCLRRLGHTAEALSVIDALLARSPDKPSIWKQKGQLLIDAGRPADALAAYERALALVPGDAGAAGAIRRLTKAAAARA